MARPRKFDHNAAFELWYGEVGMRRTFKQVADECEVRPDTIYKTAEREKWRERADQRDKAVRAEADKKMVKTHAQRVVDNLKIIDALKAVFTRQLMPGSGNPLDTLTPREYIEIVKLEQLMTGQPTSVQGEQVRSRTLDEIDLELADMADDDIDADLSTIEGIKKRLTAHVKPSE